jgi:hypothetical protein
MLTKSRAWLIAALVALVSLAYPVSVTLKLSPEAKEAGRWIQNDPAFNVFMPFIFFLALGVFLASADFTPIGSLGSYKFISFGILVILLSIASFAVVSTLDRPLLEPFLFKDAHAALEKEAQIRKEVRPSYRGLDKIDDEGELKDAARSLDALRGSLLGSYKQEFPAFGSFSELRRRGSYCAWLALLVNAVVGLFVTLIFWYLWNIVLFRAMFRINKPEWIVLVTGLLVFWFPARLYTEWYIGMYSFDTMKDYPLFLFLAIVAAAAYAFSVFRLAKSFSVKLFSAVGTGLLGAIGLIGRFQPKWLGKVAGAIEDMPPQWFFASLAIIVLALGAMVFSLLGLPVTIVAANRQPGQGQRRSRRSGRG